MALLKIEGKTPVLKERFASLERIGNRIRAYFLRKGVGRESRGDDLLGSERMRLRISSEDTGWRTENREGKEIWVMRRLIQEFW